MRINRIAAVLVCVMCALCGTVSAFGDEHNGSGHHRDHDRGGPVVLDANGKVVGPLTTYGNFDGVIVNVDHVATFIPIIRSSTGSLSEFLWWVNGLVSYASPGCSGRPLIASPFNGPRPSVAVREGTDVVLYIGADTNSASFPVGSALEGTLCVAKSGTVAAFTPESDYALSRHFPEPLKIGE